MEKMFPKLGLLKMSITRYLKILTVGKGASPSNLKIVVEMIPKNIICEMYNCTFSSFEVQINEKLASAQDYSSTSDILYKVLKRFLIWMIRTKGEEDTSKKRKEKEKAKEEKIKEPIPRKKIKLNNSMKLTLLIVQWPTGTIFWQQAQNRGANSIPYKRCHW
jgi:hypothetical protein